MRGKGEGFLHSDSPEPHRARTKLILSRHPEIRELIGKNPWSFFLILFCFMLQTTLAFVLVEQPWWVMVLTAYTVGAVATHALAVLVHECSHNLIFKKKMPNYLSGILANLAMAVPNSVPFKRYHLKHHAHQGVYDLDADIASQWEAKLVGNSSIRKLLWLFLFPVFTILRTPRVREVRPIDRWILTNMVAVFAFDAAIFVLAGPWGLFYLFLSLIFSMGLHPLGARWIQEHYVVRPPQETYSYYGALNFLALNVGYHNEHHDFPSVPWNRLPKIRALAPEFYDNLFAHTSLTRLLYQFVTDPEMSLKSRVLREDAKTGVAAE